MGAFVLVIAHRGASYDAPEHTSFAYQTAVEQGADLIELDLQLAGDGTLVCLHDASLERVAGVRRQVAELALDELQRFDIGSWFNRAHPDRARTEYATARVVPLDEQLDVLDRLPLGVGLYLELKDPGVHGGRMEEAVVAALARHGLTTGDRPIVLESFDAGSLRRLKELAPELPTALAWVRATVELAAGEVPDWVDISAPNSFGLFLHADHVGRMHASGRAVHVWTVDDPEEVASLVQLQVDGIFTNRPGLVRAVIDR